ncbi:TIGR04290 family methyltransferase [Marinivivus vitaminiproducens]|uniref:TIGR04290 family methyltransferase n=1 Tax=Marinivivus vitaminiproducens TaxID=3035935 RepID=UPI0027A5AC9E|nr:TIGR04290 family methyltransferase [Geminicoccaceae bacterium SCSIO 64248]
MTGQAFIRSSEAPWSLEKRIRALGPWFHNMVLDGVSTAPAHFLGDYPRFKWDSFKHLVPDDLAGAAVLDIGCNAGFYALEMKRRGASHVVAIDSDDRYLAQAQLAAETMGLTIDLRRMSVYEVGSLARRFDLVLFMGVLYHLRHPLLALDLLHEHAVGDRLIVQSMLRGIEAHSPVAENYPFDTSEPFDAPAFPRLCFVEHRFADDPTNWWIPNRTGMEAMLRSSGFVIESQASDDVYLCRHGERSWAVERPPVVHQA